MCLESLLFLLNALEHSLRAMEIRQTVDSPNMFRNIRLKCEHLWAMWTLEAGWGRGVDGLQVAGQVAAEVEDLVTFGTGVRGCTV